MKSNSLKLLIMASVLYMDGNPERANLVFEKAMKQSDIEPTLLALDHINTEASLEEDSSLDDFDDEENSSLDDFDDEEDASLDDDSDDDEENSSLDDDSDDEEDASLDDLEKEVNAAIDELIASEEDVDSVKSEESAKVQEALEQRAARFKANLEKLQSKS